jgi:hypothetical protein
MYAIAAQAAADKSAAASGKPKEETVSPETTPPEEQISTIKPEGFSLKGFRSTKPAEISNVATQIERFRLALASKPYDSFFLCHVPSQRLDNSWNESNLAGCLQAKTLWTQATSLKETGQEKYKVSSSKDPDAFPEPNWPTQSLDQLIWVTFANCMIQRNDHPALLPPVPDTSWPGLQE